MENCLKQTLKGQVNNNNLPIFGVNTLEVKYVAGATANLSISIQPTADYDIKVKCKDGVNHLTVNGNACSEYTIAKGSAAIAIGIENADYLVDIYGVRYGGVKLFILKNNVFVCDIASMMSLSNPDKTTRYQIHSVNVSGNIAPLAAMTGLTFLSLETCNVYGDASVFGNMKSLTTLNFAQTNITGSVESLVTSWLSGSNPKTLDTPMNILGLYQLQFGVFASFAFAYTYLMYNNAGTKIAMYHGGTNSGYDTCPTVYIKGYKNDGTDSEYNTNVGSGGIWENKTVIDVTTGDTWHSPA